MVIYEGVMIDPRVFAVLAHVEAWSLTGSRMIYPEGVEQETDWDFIMLSAPPGSEKEAMFRQVLTINGFHDMGPDLYDPDVKAGSDHESHLWRLETPKTDMIVFVKEEAYKRWLVATKVCRALHLARRADRVMVFRAIRTGEFFDPATCEKKEMKDVGVEGGSGAG